MESEKFKKLLKIVSRSARIKGQTIGRTLANLKKDIELIKNDIELIKKEKLNKNKPPDK